MQRRCVVAETAAVMERSEQVREFCAAARPGGGWCVSHAKILTRALTDDGVPAVARRVIRWMQVGEGEDWRPIDWEAGVGHWVTEITVPDGFLIVDGATGVWVNPGQTDRWASTITQSPHSVVDAAVMHVGGRMRYVNPAEVSGA